MRIALCIMLVLVQLIACGQNNGRQGKSIKTAKENSHSILYASLSEIDSAITYSLNRTSMEGYERVMGSYSLTRGEIANLIKLMTDSTNFHEGTPLMFQFTSGITIYFKGKTNTIWLCPAARKLLEQDFAIPYNQVQASESTAASYFPCINARFAKFLTRIEKKSVD